MSRHVTSRLSIRITFEYTFESLSTIRSTHGHLDGPAAAHDYPSQRSCK